MGELRSLQGADAREMMRDPMVLQALQLSGRLREIKGDVLDSEEYIAISEATGVSEEYIRFLEQENISKSGQNFFDRLRTQYFSLDSDARRYVSSGLLGTFFALLLSFGLKVDTYTGLALHSSYGVFQSIACVIAIGAAYNAAVAKNGKSAALTGAIFGTLAYLLGSIFSMLLLIRYIEFPAMLVLVAGGAGALIGFLLNSILSATKKGPKVRGDRSADARQTLLKQLVDLQEQLREGQQTATFLSLDVVGSTKMKLHTDPLAVEFTFNEYHNFVARIAEKHFGKIHSTAGDGITVAFEHPQNAFNAARQIQTGLVEFNAFRNKLDQPLQLRAGIHTGQVVAPEAGNMTSINFASVIDIAAHLQKEAPTGGVAVSDSASAAITGGTTSVGTDRICVHETWATIWRRKKSLDHFKLPEAAAQGT